MIYYNTLSTGTGLNICLYNDFRHEINTYIVNIGTNF